MNPVSYEIKQRRTLGTARLSLVGRENAIQEARAMSLNEHGLVRVYKANEMGMTDTLIGQARNGEWYPATQVLSE